MLCRLSDFNASATTRGLSPVRRGAHCGKDICCFTHNIFFRFCIVLFGCRQCLHFGIFGHLVPAGEASVAASGRSGPENQCYKVLNLEFVGFDIRAHGCGLSADPRRQ